MDDDRRDGARTGIWKMVYADFATALMAFFLVLWLASTASEAQRDLIADFFNPVSISREQSGANGVLGGRAIDSEGGEIDNHGVDTERLVGAPPVVAELGTENNPPFTGVEMTPQTNPTQFSAPQQIAMQAKLDEIEERLKGLLNRTNRRNGYQDVVIINRRPMSIEIEVTEGIDFEMFARGKSDLSPPARELFRELGWTLSRVPWTVRIAGHTDSSAFRGKGSNWSLSALRADSARVALIDGGLNPDRVVAVEGKADTNLLNATDPLDPRNRRITVSILAAVSPSSDLLFGTLEQ